MSRIFISYSRAGEDRPKGSKWQERVAEYLSVFRDAQLIDLWHDAKIEAGLPWEPEIQKAMATCSVAILLLGPEFLESEFILNQELPVLAKRQADDGIVVVPLVCEPCHWDSHAWIRTIQLIPGNQVPLSDMTEDDRDRVLQRMLERVAGKLSDDAIAATDATSRASAQSAPSPKIYTHPALNSAWNKDSSGLRGRDAELALLHHAFGNQATGILSLVAWGGVGKTALSWAWIDECRRHEWFGCEKVFLWTFYSQGMQTDRPASEDHFLRTALDWFGLQVEPTASPSFKAEAIAAAILAQRTLVLLDGLEPMQDADRDGALKTPGLVRLLDLLSAAGGDYAGSLCLITTRIPVQSLQSRQAVSHSAPPTVQRLNLPNLNPSSGARVLHAAGARRFGGLLLTDTHGELLKTSRALGGHALSLFLLGRYLDNRHTGDLRHQEDVGFSEADRTSEQGHAFRVLDAFERWFDTIRGETGRRRIALLRILGLFDRPMSPEAQRSLRRQPSIPGLSEPFADGVGEDDGWNQAVTDLVKLGLIEQVFSDDNLDAETGLIDCHALIRQYNAERLQKTGTEGWSGGHERLYQDMRQTLPSRDEAGIAFPAIDAVVEAVYHGCAAGRYDDAYRDIFEGLIQQGTRHFARNRFGCFDSDFAALRSFLKNDVVPVDDLADQFKSEVYVHLGFYQRVRGHLERSEAACRAGMEFSSHRGDWNSAARSALNLSEACMTQGRLIEAEEYARRSVELAELSKDSFLQMYTRMLLGTVLHQAGTAPWNDALQAFLDAERVQAAREPKRPLLYSHWGYQFNELLFDLRDFDRVLGRVCLTKKWSKDAGSHRWQALDMVAFVRALCERSNWDARKVSRWKTRLERAVDDVLQLGQEHEKPPVLLVRARMSLELAQFDAARRDIDAADTIAQTGNMVLQRMDAALLRRRVALAKPDMFEPSHDATVLELEGKIRGYGYGRRLIAIDALRASL